MDEPIEGAASELSAEAVSHPSHYNQGKIEVIDACEDWQLEAHEFNVVKYVARAQWKGKRLEDLEKALWYLARKIWFLGEEPEVIKGVVAGAIKPFKVEK
jgi:hypothetical protein